MLIVWWNYFKSFVEKSEIFYQLIWKRDTTVNWELKKEEQPPPVVT